MDKLIKFVSKYGVLLLLIGVAFHQMYQVDNGLSRWKGGGFGMYSEIHYNQVKIFVRFMAKQEDLVNKEFVETDELNRRLKLAQRFASQDNCMEVAKEVQNISGIPQIKIEVWRPRFNPVTKAFYREKTKEYTFRK